MVLVGDEPYYAKAGFKRIPKGRSTMPGPVDPARLLVAELVEGAFDQITGAIRPDWDCDSTIAVTILPPAAYRPSLAQVAARLPTNSNGGKIVGWVERSETHRDGFDLP